jgi:hypothetical protein
MPQRINVPGMGIVEFPDGMSDDQMSAAIKQNMPKQESQGMDIAKSAGEGLKSAGIALGSFGGDLRLAALGGAEYLTGKIVGPDRAAEAFKMARPYAEKAMQLIPQFSGPTTAENRAAIEPVTGPAYAPQTTAGRYTKGIAEFRGLCGIPRRQTWIW